MSLLVLLPFFANIYFGWARFSYKYPLYSTYWMTGLFVFIAFIGIFLSQREIYFESIPVAFFMTGLSAAFWSFLGWYIGKGVRFMFSSNEDKSDVGGST